MLLVRRRFRILAITLQRLQLRSRTRNKVRKGEIEMDRLNRLTKCILSDRGDISRISAGQGKDQETTRNYQQAKDSGLFDRFEKILETLPYRFSHDQDDYDTRIYDYELRFYVYGWKESGPVYARLRNSVNTKKRKIDSEIAVTYNGQIVCWTANWASVFIPGKWVEKLLAYEH
jgi:hypothetical protein